MTSFGRSVGEYDSVLANDGLELHVTADPFSTAFNANHGVSFDVQIKEPGAFVADGVQVKSLFDFPVAVVGTGSGERIGNFVVFEPVTDDFLGEVGIDPSDYGEGFDGFGIRIGHLHDDGMAVLKDGSVINPLEDLVIQGKTGSWVEAVNTDGAHLHIEVMGRRVLKDGSVEFVKLNPTSYSPEQVQLLLDALMGEVSSRV